MHARAPLPGRRRRCSPAARCALPPGARSRARPRPGRRGARSAARCRSRRCRSRGTRVRRPPPSVRASRACGDPPGSSAGPTCSSGTPFARCAAAGANTSRPWKVLETGNSSTRESSMAAASSAPPERRPSHREQPVVGPQQQRAGAGAHRDRSALGPDARVHHGDVDRVRRHVPRGASQRERAAHDVLARDVVRQIDHADVRGDRGHDAVAHADELVGATVVGHEDHRPRHGPALGAAVGRYCASHVWMRLRTCSPWLPVRRSVPWSAVVKICTRLGCRLSSYSCWAEAAAPVGSRHPR